MFAPLRSNLAQPTEAGPFKPICVLSSWCTRLICGYLFIRPLFPACSSSLRWEETAFLAIGVSERDGNFEFHTTPAPSYWQKYVISVGISVCVCVCGCLLASSYCVESPRHPSTSVLGEPPPAQMPTKLLIVRFIELRSLSDGEVLPQLCRRSRFLMPYVRLYYMFRYITLLVFWCFCSLSTYDRCGCVYWPSSSQRYSTMKNYCPIINPIPPNPSHLYTNKLK